MSTHYQSNSNPLNQPNAMRITLDGFDVLIAKQVGDNYKATFMNGFEHTEYYNEILFDMNFTSFEAAKKQCQQYVNSLLESAYCAMYDL